MIQHFKGFSAFLHLDTDYFLLILVFTFIEVLLREDLEEEQNCLWAESYFSTQH